MMRLLFWVLLLSACNKGPKIASLSTAVKGFHVELQLLEGENPTLPALQFDPDLVTFRDTFDKQAEQAGVHIDAGIAAQLRVMKMEDQVPAEPGATGTIAGLCLTFAAKNSNAIDGSRTIFWKEIHVERAFVTQYGLQSPQIKMVLFHELFHCRFGKLHIDPTTTSLAEAIMFPSVNFDDPVLFGNLDLYITQMFSPALMQLTPNGPSTEDIVTAPGWEKLKL